MHHQVNQAVGQEWALQKVYADDLGLPREVPGRRSPNEPVETVSRASFPCKVR
jgi:hypothetical protein